MLLAWLAQLPQVFDGHLIHLEGILSVLKQYIFWGIFALVLVGVGFSVASARPRNLRQKGGGTGVAGSAISAPVTPVASQSMGEQAASQPVDPFDPNATRILFSAEPARGAVTSKKRVETVLPTGSSAHLICVAGVNKGSRFEVSVAGITVGRDPQSDIVITDSRVSNQHAWVGIVDRKAVLRDLGSTNGTFLNAQIESPVSEVVLALDDTIFFGGLSRDQFRFVID